MNLTNEILDELITEILEQEECADDKSCNFCKFKAAIMNNPTIAAQALRDLLTPDPQSITINYTMMFQIGMAFQKRISEVEGLMALYNNSEGGL